jgi:hypothetical protein
MFTGIIWSAVWTVITGIVGGTWLGQGGTSTSDTPPQPLPNKPESEVGQPVIAPKPFIPSGRSDITINLSPPPGDTAPKFNPPPTIKAPAYIKSDLVAASLPPKWKWGPVPAGVWLVERIRNWDWGQRDLPGVGESPQAQFKFGKLLAGNMSLEVLPRWEWTFAVDEQAQKDHHQESFDAYAYWLANQAAGVPFPDDYAGDFYDQGAIIWPLDPRDFSGGVTMLFGARFLGDLFANWWTRSLNYDAATLRGVTYFDIGITKSKATWERNYSEDKSEVDSESGFEGLAYSLANIIASQTYGPVINRPHIVLENAHVSAAAVLLGKGSYPGFYPRSWCNKSAEEIQAEIDKERELIVKELGNAVDPNIIRLYEARLDELSAEAAEVGSGLLQLNKINNIPEHIQALSNCLAEVMGAYPYKIVLEKGSFLRKKLIPLNLATMENYDDVPVQYRIQELDEETVSVPNVSEALAEVTGMLLNLQGFIDLKMEFLQRISAELVALRSTTAQTFDRTEAIMDFLGFDLSYVDEKMPISFSPTASGTDILNLLQGSLVKYKKPLFKANKHNSTLQVQLYHLLKGASIIKAVHFKPFQTDNPLSGLFDDEDTDFGKYLKQLVNGLNKDNTATFKKSDGTEVSMDFEEFIEFVETGWAQFTIDPDDTRKPYGKDYNQRPRIWDLSKGDE